MRHHFLYMGLTMQTHILLHQSHNFPRRHIHIFSNAHFQLLLQITHTVRYATSDGGDWWGLGGGRVGGGGVGTFSGHTRPINRLILWQTEVSRKSGLLFIEIVLTANFLSPLSCSSLPSPWQKLSTFALTLNRKATDKFVSQNIKESFCWPLY